MVLRKFFLLLFFLTVSLAKGQMILYSNVSHSVLKNRHDTSFALESSPWHAASEVLGINLGVWGFDRFITQSDFAHISFGTIRDNFKNGFVWDNDHFLTNLFMHPYHGGLYFNAARLNGLSYTQSLPFTVGGSLMWEFFMEKEYPSINDFITTSIGGAGLGEVTYRLSDRILDNRSRGVERVGRETVSFLMSPERGLKRFLTGEAFHRQCTKGNLLPSIPLTCYANLEYRNLFDDAENNKDISSIAALTLGFVYGNPYDEDNDKPYDFFSFRLSTNLFSHQPFIGQVNFVGMLYADRIALKSDKRALTWGIFQHFNYYESTADSSHVTLFPYKLSEAASIGPGLLYKKVASKKKRIFYASAYLSAIFMGSSQSDHYLVDERDYNLGSGFSTKLNVEWLFNQRFAVRFRAEDYRIFTWLGQDSSGEYSVGASSQGDRSDASLSVGLFNLEYLLTKHCFIGLESSYYFRRTVYQHYPDVEHGVNDNKVVLGWLF